MTGFEERIRRQLHEVADAIEVGDGLTAIWRGFTMTPTCRHTGLCWCLMPEWERQLEKLRIDYPDLHIWYDVKTNGNTWFYPVSITWRATRVVIGGGFVNVIERPLADADSADELAKMIKRRITDAPAN
jgi:hypothetical protein